MTLDDLVSKFGEAGAAASAACDDYIYNRLKSLFDEDENGTLIPKTKNIAIGDTVVSMPMFSLISHTRLGVEKFKVQFKANVQFAEEKNKSPIVLGHSGLLRKGVEISAEITFNSEAAPESIELLRDKGNKELAAALSGVLGSGPCQHTIAPQPPSEDSQSQAGQCDKCSKVFSRQMIKRTKEYGEWTVVTKEE